MRKEMTISLLRQRDVLARIIVTPREIDQYLAKQSGDIENQEFNVSHILLSLPQAADARTARGSERPRAGHL